MTVNSIPNYTHIPTCSETKQTCWNLAFALVDPQTCRPSIILYRARPASQKFCVGKKYAIPDKLVFRLTVIMAGITAYRESFFKKTGKSEQDFKIENDPILYYHRSDHYNQTTHFI